MSDQSIAENFEEEELVTLEFISSETEELLFTADIPASDYKLLVLAAEQEGISVEKKLLDIITDQTKNTISADSNADETVVEDPEN